MYICITDEGVDEKKAKSTKKCVIKWEKKFQDAKDCLKNPSKGLGMRYKMYSLEKLTRLYSVRDYRRLIG